MKTNVNDEPRYLCTTITLFIIPFLFTYTLFDFVRFNIAFTHDSITQLYIHIINPLSRKSGYGKLVTFNAVGPRVVSIYRI